MDAPEVNACGRSPVARWFFSESQEREMQIPSFARDDKYTAARAHGQSGTRVVSTISRRIDSACSDFFCVET
jgi:hypothetical protein